MDEGGHDSFQMALAPRDPELFAQNMAEVTRLTGELAAAIGPTSNDTVAGFPLEAAKTFADVWASLAGNPEAMVRAQSDLWRSYFELWDYSAKRLGKAQAGTSQPSEPNSTEESWSQTPVFDILRQGYLTLGKWARETVAGAEGLQDHTRHKASFYLEQILAAVSPTNFLATNPDLLAQTLEESGENLVRGLEALIRDVKAGHGELRIRQSDPAAFSLGENIADTPGGVVYRNHLFELLQYAPTTETVRRRPLLFVPPWINKYYILDLNREKSLLRWLVEQGHTVFMMSWVNPDHRHAALSFDDYMRDGIYAALDVVRDICDHAPVDAVGYCIGGTLLSATLAHMAAEGDDRIASCTLLTAQVDFTHAGDLKVFIDEEQIRALERRMAEKGYLDGADMANAFNMLRPKDLIWRYVVDNYIRGKEPAAFDLLYWNSDSTRLPAANHAFYLRHCYLNNDLAGGRMVLAGRTIDVGDITVPIYSLATREDHIAPARSVYKGSGLFGGDTTFVMAGSGHVAGVVNPPYRNKYGFRHGDRGTLSFDEWIDEAEETAGSWWPHWQNWLAALDDERTDAREVGSEAYSVLDPAPGRYVRETS